jgi:hypothetical protein
LLPPGRNTGADADADADADDSNSIAMRSHLQPFVTSIAWQSLNRATEFMAHFPSPPTPGLFITARETDILRFVAHTWLVWHSIQSRNDLHEQKKRKRPYLYNLRRVLNGFVALGSAFAAANALWHLTS